MTGSGTCASAVCLPRSRSTGKERDAESGNDYFGARYYASSMGRWMSPDWAPNAQAVPYADFTHPQTLNLYQYMRNNPLGGADADGHCDICNQLISVVTTKVSTYLAQHPDVAKAMSAAPAKVLGTLGIKLSGGVGAGVKTEGAQLSGSAMGYVSYSADKGAGAGTDFNAGAKLGPAGGSVNYNVPLVKDGELGGAPSLSGEGALAGKMGKADGEAATSLDEASVGVAGGEGLMGGVQVSADLEGAWDIGKEMFNGAIDDAKQFASDLKVSTTCGSSGCAPPPPPADKPQ